MKSAAPTGSPTIPAQWAWHHSELVRLREQLLGECFVRSEALRVNQGGDLGDSADAASNEWQQDELLAELSAKEAEIAEIDAALERIRGGSYGICEATGRPIPHARLQAVPWARYALGRTRRSGASLS